MPGRPIQVRPIVIATVDGRYVDANTGQPPIAGDIFYQPRMLLDEHWRPHLSRHFWESYRQRIRYPIVLVLPDGHYWTMDQGSSNGTGWIVTRVPPLQGITVRPSIRTSRYHGILTKGILNPCVDSAT